MILYGRPFASGTPLLLIPMPISVNAAVNCCRTALRPISAVAKSGVWIAIAAGRLGAPPHRKLGNPSRTGYITGGIEEKGILDVLNAGAHAPKIANIP